MEHSSSTPEKAIERAKTWNQTNIEGTYFAIEKPLNHPMRRYVAGYVKGAYEERVKNNSKIVNGVLVINNDLVPALGWRSWD